MSVRKNVMEVFSLLMFSYKNKVFYVNTDRQGLHFLVLFCDTNIYNFLFSFGINWLLVKFEKTVKIQISFFFFQNSIIVSEMRQITLNKSLKYCCVPEERLDS